MKPYSKEQLDKILELHQKWFYNEGGGTRADLSGANLRGVNLSRANLSRANLEQVNFIETNLSRANLRGANLQGVNLEGANLLGANLLGANLEGANLLGANFEGAQLGNYSIVPEEGSFYAFKKLESGAIAKLYVPKSAKRIGGLTGRKCRVSKAKVISITLNKEEIKFDFGMYNPKLLYRVGSWVKPDSFNDDIRLECTNGIHCFITKKEAEEYV